MAVQYCESALGKLEIRADEGFITGISICVRKPCRTSPDPDGLTELAARQLDEYFAGRRTVFDLPLRLEGTEFQKRVWLELMKIPFGAASTYGRLAEAAGRPGAARAVGGAVGRNPILIIIPCHRALASGGLGGFSAGMEAKLLLLRHEGIIGRTPHGGTLGYHYNKGRTPFYDIFDCCASDGELFGALDGAYVLSASIDESASSMSLTIEFQARPAPLVQSLIEAGIAAERGLKFVSVKAVLSQSEKKKSVGRSGGKSGGEGKMLAGKAIRGKSIPISELTPESGRVIVTGEVFGAEVREVRGKAKIAEFNVTDYTGSLRVSKFLREPGDAAYEKIKHGMYLSVQGMVSFNRWLGDIAMEPYDVMELPKPERRDEAEGGKRVELHMHSRYSQLDALTDVEELVATAARWGHRAVSLTDHGVVQGFPELCSAGKKYGIKVLYGVEAYYINDCDDRLAVIGGQDASFEDEFVFFDLETTGLNAETDKITEIGAVLVREGKILGRFQTFVDPETPIPYEITKLTGIRDSDVRGAPSEREAVEAFLDFAGGRLLAAHNADFDMGFIAAACRRLGRDFNSASIDTLVLSQALLPELKKHSLDSVAAHLGLPEFKHHRASDDAATGAQLLFAFFERLKGLGAGRVAEINTLLASLRKESAGAMSVRQPKHIMILVMEQRGVRNLYELVSRAHLEYFKKHPIIPKSLLVRLRDGLLIGSACENGEIYRAVSSRRSWRELIRLSEFYDFLEIQPRCNNAFLIRTGKAADEAELMEFNRKIVRLGEITGKPVVATGDVHFLEPQHEIFRRILLSNKFEDCDEPLPLYFKTTEEMLEEFSYLGGEKAREVVITNTNLIADMCGDIAPLPKGLYTPKIENSAEELKALVYGRLKELYGENPPEIVAARVDAELGDIIRCGYDVIT